MRPVSAFVVAWLVAACGSPAAPIASPSPSLTAASAAPATPSPSPTPTPTPTPAITASPSPTPSPTASPSPRPTATVAPATAALASPTRSPTSTATRNPNASASPTPLDLRPYLTAELTVVNLGDAPMTMTVTFVDPDSGDASEIGMFEVLPLQVTAQAVPPARFRLAFDYPGGKAVDAGTCTIDIEDGERVQFAVLERGGVITAGKEPADPDELLIATASRCKAGKS